VLPRCWAVAQKRPRYFDLGSEGAAVRARYRLLGQSSRLGQSRQLDGVFSIALNAGAERVYIDTPYVDFDYRSDHSHYYGRAFRPPPETTERLIFRAGDKIVGVSVMRPLPRQVGRTVLAPPVQQARYVSCRAKMAVNAYGYEWEVDGYPFTSQDGQYGRCAHAAIWSIARYHHLRFGTDRYTTSGIIDAAGLRERPDKTAPSDGMYASDIVRAFRNIGLPALQYDLKTLAQTFKGSETPHSVIRRYLNSGIPVGVQAQDHMVVLVGYGVTADGNTFYIVSDDNCGPYERRNLIPSGNNAWNLLVIPLPGRMHVAGENAEARAEEVFGDRVRAETGPGHLFSRWRDREEKLEADEGGVQTRRDGESRLEVETYATPSTTYVKGLTRRGVPADVRNHHVFAPKGNWLWVTEFHDPDSPPESRVIGEIAIDATSMQLDPDPVFGNIDGWAYTWERGEFEPSVAHVCPDGARYASTLPDRAEVAAPEVLVLDSDDDVAPVGLDDDAPV
jgi:hypothetical protein